MLRGSRLLAWASPIDELNRIKFYSRFENNKNNRDAITDKFCFTSARY